MSLNHKYMTRNASCNNNEKNANQLINFCSSGNFLNLSKIKYIPIDKSLKLNKIKLSKKDPQLNNSESNNNEKSKDEIIKQLKERIFILENKLKLLEKEKKSNSISNTYNSHTHSMKKTTIPMDLNLLKSKILNKKKKNLSELFDLNKIMRRKRSYSYFKPHMDTNPNNSREIQNNNNTNNINTISVKSNNNNKHCNRSASKNKTNKIILMIKNNTLLNTINNNLNINNQFSSSKASASFDQRKKKYFNYEQKINNNNNSRRKINEIPKNWRKNTHINNSPGVLMMSSTNYTNNTTNSFKEDTRTKKLINMSCVTCDKNTSFNEIKQKFGQVFKRTEKLLKLYSELNHEKKSKTRSKNKLSNRFFKIVDVEKQKKSSKINCKDN